MTQTEVYTLLKKKKGWMTSKELAEILGISSGSVSTNLNKLFKYGEVFRKEPQKSINSWSCFSTVRGRPYKWKSK